MAKDDIPEELVSMEWIEEHEEDDSDSCKVSTPQRNTELLESRPTAWVRILKAEPLR